MGIAYGMLLAVVALQRLMECSRSLRYQKRLEARGAKPMDEPRFRWIVTVHVLLLAGSALEVWVFQRPLVPALAVPMLALLMAAMALRAWVLATLRHGWTVRVMLWPELAVTEQGPYRHIRHPNYLAVILEFVALPLIHTAWLTALVASLLNAILLFHRIREEEQFLMSLPAYQASMAAKPRFLPLRLMNAG